ncbi:hypothetical protein [Cupriavidus gilardii]|uniref:Uncharacterized protein n=1 Tax=Cupriavidus gilardii TaxID=82541 RepID=A0A849BF52_9BURK|nr:hypothetical protein [Cupriavidus gilardii]KAB0597766.1 hypothetical protein F7Q96_07550 [Cupriavidus gilardii]NNH14072.1 hypothetical protein [Cupriavidus gilardii]
MCLMEKPKPVDSNIVAAISSEAQLIRKAIELSRFKFLEKTYAGYLGLSPSQFSKIKNGRDSAGKIWHMPITSVARFECLVGHTLITQWIAYQRDLMFNDDLRELHEAEQKAATLRAKILGKAA